MELARHLTNTKTNDHVDIHEIRGLLNDGDILAAFQEMEDMAAGTRCTNHLFSVSFNPVDGFDDRADIYAQALEKLEAEYEALKTQPRVLVFHEKEGRRHLHAVYSRIQEDGKAVRLEFFRDRMNQMTYDLFMEHAPEMMPDGLHQWKERAQQQKQEQALQRDELEQQRRSGTDRDTHHAVLKDAVERSETLEELQATLRESGYMLCNGKRAFVAYDVHGETSIALTRASGLKMKELKAKYQGHESLPAIDAAKDDYLSGLKKELAQQKTALDESRAGFSEKEEAHSLL